jgi:hypothetical protein
MSGRLAEIEALLDLPFMELVFRGGDSSPVF